MNAKEEFLKATEGKNVKCCEIYFLHERNDEEIIKLPVKFSNEDYLNFLEIINRDYDNGFGIQELEGNIWLDDGTWIERYEYDGSEGWTWKKTPEIPNYLQSNEDIVTIDGVEYQFIEEEVAECGDCAILQMCSGVDGIKICSADYRSDGRNGYFIKKEIK